MRGDPIEIFKMINRISNYGKDFFKYFYSNWKFTVKIDFKT